MVAKSPTEGNMTSIDLMAIFAGLVTVGLVTLLYVALVSHGSAL